MRIFNATSSTMSLPFSNSERITISAMSPSKELMCSTEFLSMLITTFTVDQIAIIVSGPFEISAITNIPTIVNYVVQSLDEAISRFNVISEDKKDEAIVEDAKKDDEATCTCGCSDSCECDGECSCAESETTTTTKKKGSKSSK